jgi:Domain of unknown function DUF29
LSALANQELYDRDFYAWTLQQAELLRAGRLSSLDLKNIAEEIESMGRSENNELISRLAVLLAHLLKWQFQPAFQGKSWLATIAEQRRRLKRHLAENPSLKSKLDEDITEGYDQAVAETVSQTGMDKKTFPSICPYSFAQMMDAEFWPE